MAKIVLTPEQFTMVEYDANVIRDHVSELAQRVGVPDDEEVRVEVNERTPLGRARLVSLDPITLDIEGGALEDPTNPRHWGRRNTTLVVGRLMLRALDRKSGAFDGAPTEEELDIRQLTAWDTYSYGRLERLGYDGRKSRAQYHFRNRHGFTDVADAVFERLWTAKDLSWADIAAACEETEAAKQPA